MKRTGAPKNYRITKILKYAGLVQMEIDTAQAGDIVAVAGSHDGVRVPRRHERTKLRGYKGPASMSVTWGHGLTA